MTQDFLEKLVAATEAAPAPEGLRAAAAAAGRLVRRSSPLATLALGAALAAAPAAAADASLLCKGANTQLPAAATRAFAASLLPVAALLVVAREAEEGGATPRPGVAYGLLACCAAQAAALRADGHALRVWARRLLLPPVAAAGLVGGWYASRA